jgi:hypothetical protein
MEFYIIGLAFCVRSRSARWDCSWDEPVNLVLMALGCIFIALGLTMAANRGGYLYFVVGPRSVLALAAIIAAVLTLFILLPVKPRPPPVFLGAHTLPPVRTALSNQPF